MSGLRHRLVRLERGAATTLRGATGAPVFQSVQRGIELLELDLRERAASWTNDQRATLAALRTLPRKSSTFADLSNEEFALLSTLVHQRFALV